MRRGVLVLAVLAALAAAATGRSAPAHAACSSSYVSALVGGAPKCLRAGEFCSPSSEPDYAHYGFACVGGRLREGGAAPRPAPVVAPTKLAIGTSVALAHRTRAGGCRKGALPDRRCSPGAYYSGLTKSVVCAPSYRTGTVRNVPQAEKFAVEREYGMAATYYGRSIEIDHIVPLELGRVERGREPLSGARVRGRELSPEGPLENRLHELVCSGRMSLAAARHGIAAEWEHQYRQVFGSAP